jgi:glycosyltransferase involved in cell wall biosynthesis
MKILWLSHLVPFPPKGGVLQRSFNLIKETAKEHQITLLCFNQGAFLEGTLPEQKEPLNFAKTELLKYVRRVEIVDLPEERIPGGRYWMALKAIVKGSSYNMEWLRSCGFRERLIRLLGNEKFDLVHIDTVSLCIYADLLGTTPTILNHHNFESSMLEQRSKKEKNTLKRWFYSYEASRLLQSEKYYVKNAWLNITCSDQDANEIKSTVVGANVRSIPNGVDLSYFSPNGLISPIPNRIALVGGLSWYPNRDAVEYFFQSIWPLLKDRCPESQVDIIGRNPDEAIREYAKREPRIHVHGFVDDVRNYLWRTEYYLCPIRIGGGTKLKILDALASGCCIIAHPFACKGIEVKDGQHLLFAESAEDYVEKIELLKANPDLRAKLRAEGPKLIESTYSYEGIGRKYSCAVRDTVTMAKNQGERFDEPVYSKNSL